MKKLAVCTMGGGDIIVIDITKKMIDQLKIIIDINKNNIPKNIFDNGIVFNIPLTEEGLSSYRWSSTFEKMYEKNEDILNFKTIEYLCLEEDERAIHCKKYNVDDEYVIFEADEDSFNSFSKNLGHGSLLISNDVINIEFHKHSIPTEILLSENISISSIIN
jgi:hypothetical protein